MSEVYQMNIWRNDFIRLDVVNYPIIQVWIDEESPILVLKVHVLPRFTSNPK